MITKNKTEDALLNTWRRLTATNGKCGLIVTHGVWIEISIQEQQPFYTGRAANIITVDEFVKKVKP